MIKIFFTRKDALIKTLAELYVGKPHHLRTYEQSKGAQMTQIYEGELILSQWWGDKVYKWQDYLRKWRDDACKSRLSNS